MFLLTMTQDVIFYYRKIFPKLMKFLQEREIATKTMLKEVEIVKRGSNSPPLYIDELIKGVNDKFLNLRKENHLKDVKSKLTKTQIKIWEYIVPRKLVELHYATNHEHPNKPLKRIVFDIDRKDIPAEKAQVVALKLIEQIQKDKTFPIKYKIFPLWTGNSFHIYLLLQRSVTHDFYEKKIHIEPNQDESFTGKWVRAITKELKEIKVAQSHEKKKGYIIIDPSQSPSGKITRAPFSIYAKSSSTIKGIALPLTIEDLKKKNLIKELRSYTTEKVIKNINKLSKKIP